LFSDADLPVVVSGGGQAVMIIDFAEKRNASYVPLTAMNNHNGLISNVTKLVMAVERQRAMPSNFRYNAGKIKNVDPIRLTMAEQKAYRARNGYAIADAGSCGAVQGSHSVYQAGCPCAV